MRVGLRRLLRPWVSGPEGQRWRELPQGSTPVSRALSVLENSQGRGVLLADSLSPDVSLTLLSMGGIGCHASGVQRLKSQPRQRVRSWEIGRPDVPVQTQAPRRSEWRALLWRPVSVWDCGVGVHGRFGWLSGAWVFLRAGGFCAGPRGPVSPWVAARVLRWQYGVPGLHT